LRNMGTILRKPNKDETNDETKTSPRAK